MKKLSLLLACALLALAALACMWPALDKSFLSTTAGSATDDTPQQGYAKIMQELQPQLLKLQQEQNLENMCKFYDDALEKLK